LDTALHEKSPFDECIRATRAIAPTYLPIGAINPYSVLGAVFENRPVVPRVGNPAAYGRRWRPSLTLKLRVSEEYNSAKAAWNAAPEKELRLLEIKKMSVVLLLTLNISTIMSPLHHDLLTSLSPLRAYVTLLCFYVICPIRSICISSSQR